MLKTAAMRICLNCGKHFKTYSSKQKCCSKACTKAHWKKKVKELGHGIYNSGVGRKKGITPWNKNKTCPQLAGENNGFFGKHHSKETLNRIKLKSEITKTKNKTFNASQEETKIGEYLREKFPDVLFQYKSNRYPFFCDFYIPSQDLFIEYQGHWTHGIYKHKVLGKYNPENPKHQEVLTIWKDKKSKYFDRAIKTWTELDPRKDQYIQKHKLNFKKFYTICEFLEWYDKLP